MGVHKGTVNNPNGRPLGAINKSTKDAREAIAAFVDGNADRLTGWLDEMAKEDPKQAFDAFMSVVEYHIPKLARQEHTGLNGNAIEHIVTTSPDDKSLIQRYLDQKEKHEPRTINGTSEVVGNEEQITVGRTGQGDK